MDKQDIHDKALEKMARETGKSIEKLRLEITEEINYTKGEVDKVKSNYNEKFAKVHNKLDTIISTNNSNQIKLIKAIHSVDLKVTSLGNK